MPGQSFFRAGERCSLASSSNDGWRIDSLDLDTGERRTIIERGNPAPVCDGRTSRVLPGRSDVHGAVRCGDAQVTGPAAPLLDDVPMLTSEIPLLDVSLSGTVMYSATTAFSTLVWVSRTGEEQVLNAERRSYANPRFSPDGQRFIVQAGDLWVQDLARAHVQPADDRDDIGERVPDLVARRASHVPQPDRVYGSRERAAPADDAQVIPGTTDLDYPGVIAPDGDYAGVPAQHRRLVVQHPHVVAPRSREDVDDSADARVRGRRPVVTGRSMDVVRLE